MVSYLKVVYSINILVSLIMNSLMLRRKSLPIAFICLLSTSVTHAGFTMSIKPAIAIPTTVSDVNSTQHPQSWEILDSDLTLQRTFERWGKQAKWEVRWEGVPEIKNTGYTKFSNISFLDAADLVFVRVKVAASAVGLQILVTAHPDQVLVISNRSLK